ncbi:uncharacterized protein LOC5499925 isoform X3 [Nematostella vectensis]|uniref:uncharacterized protein LOC5499925 isoform X2 n=1 Tax=Nematostella vectensis TaxID=45351 RepID=UPI0020775915|nr:uncharacterized protein LOC5499925 isoform X2 [Nematostella vectensis]XP_048589875.1 uncharacterized protein LOC5499925 isoform X3 [Nematostella vectensis]
MSSAEKHAENFLKLCRLLVDGGSSGLRKKFDSIHPPSNLTTVLNDPVNHGVLHNLWRPPRGRKPVINNTQWNTLYPKHGSHPPTSHDFDVTLLFILLRNICGLTPPITGWDALPAAGDTSPEAHLARIKYCRNNLYAHATHASIDDAQFEKYWKEISAALVALGVSASDIHDLKTRPGETAYVRLLKDWRESDVDILQEVSKVQSSVQDVGQHVAKGFKDVGQNVAKGFKDVGQQVQSVDKKVQDIDQNVAKGFQKAGQNVQSVHEKAQDIEQNVAKGFQDVGQHFQNLQKGIQAIKKDAERDKAAAEHEELVKQEEAIKKWVDFLIEEYSTGGTTDITPLPWIESDPMFTLKKLFKEPTISENVKINDLFKSKTKKRMSKRVLLEGEPGVGKSTLCKKLVNSWALSVQRCEQTDDSSSGEEGPCFSSTEHSSNSTSPFPAEVEIVLLLKCREIVDTEDWKDILRQEIPENYAGEDKERIIEYICNNEKRVALVIDGYDELNTSEKALHKILCKKALPQSFILMTSRKNRMQAEVKNCFDASLEIKGIESSSGEQLILDYFRSSVGGVPNQLLPLILERDTRELLRNPLHAAMLCVIIEDNKELLTSPPSLNITTLYKEFIFCLTKRFVKREGLSVDDNEIEGGYYRDLILKIGKYAFDALLEDKLTFTAKDLPRDLLEIGFVEKNKATKKIRCQEVSYSFLHKSLQDYLAALHFACCLSQGDEDVFWYVDLDVLFTFRYYDIVSMIGPDRSCVAVKFLGKMLMEWNGCKDLKNQNRWNVLGRIPSSSVYSTVIGWICEFLDECNRQDQDILSEVALYLPKYVFFDLYYNNKRAVSGLCHWLSYQPGALHHGTCSLPVSNVSVAEAKNTGIVELSLSPLDDDLLSSEIIQTILKQNTSLRCLRLDSLCIYLDKALLALADLIVHNNAIEILQCYIPLNIHVVNALKHNKSLRSLNLSLLNCADDCVMAIADMIYRNTLLKELTINDMEPKHVDVIANALRDNVSIKTLTLLGSLEFRNILVKMLSRNNVLEKVVFESMFDYQAAHLLKTIKHETNLKRVSLGILITSDENSIALAEQIQQSKVIDELRIGYYKDCTLGPIEDLGPIASALALNKSIKSLELYGDVLSSSVADRLSQNTVIEKLKIPTQGENIAVIATSLLQNPSLKSLTIFDASIGTGIDNPDAVEIAEILSKNGVLKELFVHYKEISGKGASAFADMLSYNSVIEVLDLRSNPFHRHGYKKIRLAAHKRRCRAAPHAT